MRVFELSFSSLSFFCLQKAKPVRHSTRNVMTGRHQQLKRQRRRAVKTLQLWLFRHHFASFLPLPCLQIMCTSTSTVSSPEHAHIHITSSSAPCIISTKPQSTSSFFGLLNADPLVWPFLAIPSVFLVDFLCSSFPLPGLGAVSLVRPLAHLVFSCSDGSQCVPSRANQRGSRVLVDVRNRRWTV